MSTTPHKAASTADEPLEDLLLDYPGADIVIRYQDSYHFRVLKSTIINGSPILSELVRKTLNSFGDDAEASLPVVQLPESSTILHSLFAFDS